VFYGHSSVISKFDTDPVNLSATRSCPVCGLDVLDPFRPALQHRTTVGGQLRYEAGRVVWITISDRAARNLFVAC